MIFLSDAAVARVKKFMQKNSDAVGVYIQLRRSGCAGYSYHIDFAKEIDKKKQKIFVYSDFQLIVDNADLPLLDGLNIDVEKQGLNEKFVFHNPHAQETCGCGHSFSI